MPKQSSDLGLQVQSREGKLEFLSCCNLQIDILGFYKSNPLLGFCCLGELLGLYPLVCKALKSTKQLFSISEF